MASYQQFPAIVSGATAWERARERARKPARVFLLLSILFGPLIVLLTPPLCGPDESAHFLRADGLAAGEIVPRMTDDKGRKGVRLAAPLYRDFDLFEGARYRVRDPTFVFYVGWPPLEVDRIEGVQGRYFLVLLPAIAMAVAAAVDWGPSQRATAFAAALGAVVSGAATIEGILRVDWRMW
jgi:hypothetical protein